MTRTMALVTALASLLVASCERSTDDRIDEGARVQKDTAEKPATIQAGADEETRSAAATLVGACDELRAGSQRELDAIATRLDELEAQAQTMTARRREDLLEALRNVDEMRSSVQESVIRIDSVASEEFGAFKATLSEQIEELQRTLNDVGSRM